MAPSASSHNQPRVLSQLRGLAWASVAGFVIFTIAVMNDVRLWVAAGCAMALIMGCCLVHYRELRRSFRRNQGNAGSRR